MDSRTGYRRPIRLIRGLACVLMAAALLASGTPGSVAAAETVAVRFGEHDDFDRVVFDWPRFTDYRVEELGDSIIIRFDAEATFDLARIETAMSRFVTGAAATSGEAVASVTIARASRGRVRHFRNGWKIVLDFFGATPRPRPVAPYRPGIAEVAADDEDEVAAESASEITAPTTDAVAARSVEISSNEPAAVKAASVKEAASPVAEVAPEQDQVSPPRRPAVPGSDVAMKVTKVRDGLRLTFSFPDPVAAAVFQRTGTTWVVFGARARVDMSALRDVHGAHVAAIEQLPARNGTVLKLTTAPMKYLSARRDEASWHIDVANMPVPPRAPLDVQRRNADRIGVRVFVPTKGAAQTVEFIDPGVGDLIIAVPLAADGFGVMAARRYAEFHLLPSAQGVVVVPKSDAVKVISGAAGVVVSGAEALAGATGRGPARVGDNGPDPFRTGRASEGARAKPDRIIDFAAWKRGPSARFNDIRKGLMYELATVPVASRNEIRWELARFLVAHRRPADALGVLGVMRQKDALIEDAKEFQALRGIARAQFGRFEEAAADLSHPGLINEPHAALWRAVTDEARGRHSEALYNYWRGVDVLWEYTGVDLAQIRLAVARAGFAEEDFNLVRAHLVELASTELPRLYVTETELLRGRMYEKLGEDRNALVSYDKVIDADVRPTRARAAMARANVLMRNGSITRDEGVESLEGLRFLWRGDDFELDLLYRLGQLYIDDGDFRAGLSTIRVAITYFGKNERTRQIASEMSEIFSRLFLGGGADQLSALDALALYYDFRELTPIGAAGDEMIRRLSERLVRVDLLGRAAELLEHQITYRLKGVPQAQVASGLAVIYLLDNEAEKALEILAKTEQPRLPEQISTRRRYLEVQALTRLERHDEAEMLLAGDKNPEAETLRGDIYWSARDWDKLAAHAEGLLDGRWTRPEALDQSERFLVLRLVVSLALADDVRGLEKMRERYVELMAGGTFYHSFDVVTSKVDFDGLELRDLVERLADVSIFQEFLTNYRTEMSGPAFSAAR